MHYKRFANACLPLNMSNIIGISFNFSYSNLDFVFYHTDYWDININICGVFFIQNLLTLLGWWTLPDSAQTILVCTIYNIFLRTHSYSLNITVSLGYLFNKFI